MKQYFLLLVVAVLSVAACSSPNRNKTIRVGDVEFEMVYVEGDTFTMGCTAEQGDDCWHFEEPCHEVSLSLFYIGRTEVTQALWREVMGRNPSHFLGDSLPVDNVSWFECQEFIDSLNRLSGLRFSLPTEAEWEYAARGGNRSRGSKYSGSRCIDSVAWYGENSHSTSHSVATLMPNELGIYDMCGNVAEWCADWYDFYDTISQSNPTGPATGRYKTLRGGAWQLSAVMCRVSDRGFVEPSDRDSIFGLRLVLHP